MCHREHDRNCVCADADHARAGVAEQRDALLVRVATLEAENAEMRSALTLGAERATRGDMEGVRALLCQTDGRSVVVLEIDRLQAWKERWEPVWEAVKEWAVAERRYTHRANANPPTGAWEQLLAAKHILLAEIAALEAGEGAVFPIRAAEAGEVEHA